MKNCVILGMLIIFSISVFSNNVMLDRSREFALGPGDEIASYVWKNDELNTITSIQPDGHITLPLIGEVIAAGKTSYELELIVTKKYQEYLIDPQVRIVIKKYISKEVTIFGYLNESKDRGVGKYSINEKTTMADVLAMAGWFGKTADIEKIEVRRKGISKPIVVNFSKYLEGSDNRQNILLQPDDKIYVPIKKVFDKVFIFGEVGSPGMIDYRKGMTLLEAITIAGNPTDNAVLTSAKIYRGDITHPDKRDLISVNLEKIIKRGQMKDNVLLRKNDIIYVPREKIVSWNNFLGKISPSISFATLIYSAVQGGLGVTTNVSSP